MIYLGEKERLEEAGLVLIKVREEEVRPVILAFELPLEIPQSSNMDCKPREGTGICVVMLCVDAKVDAR